MGNSSSTKVDNSFYKHIAYQVVHVVKESPAEQAGLVPYFDFLIYLPPVRTFGNSPLPYDEYVRDSVARQSTLELMVFNCATGCIRKVYLKPSRYGRGPLDLTGFIVRNTIIADAMSQVEHVQEVNMGSPASDVGLVPYFDYIIATDDGNCFDLHHIIRAHNPSDCLRIYVIDIFLKASRIVQIPGLTKLGERRFGCTLATGYLHRIPSYKLDFFLQKSGNSGLSRANSAEPPFQLGNHEHHGHDHEHDHHHHQAEEAKDQHDHHHHPHDANSHCDGHHDDKDHAHHHDHPNVGGGVPILEYRQQLSLKNPEVTQLHPQTSPLEPTPIVRKHSHHSQSSSCGCHDHHHHPHGAKAGYDNTHHQHPHHQQPKLPPADPNQCTFVTKLHLPVSAQGSLDSDHSHQNGNAAHHQNPLETEVPVAVQIPKEIVANVVADLVRYQKEQIKVDVTNQAAIRATPEVPAPEDVK